MENVEQKGISKEFAGAIVKALSAIKGAVKDANNPHFRSDYADLTSVIEAVKVPLSENQSPRLAVYTARLAEY